MTKQTETLETRIVAVLAADRIALSDVNALIAETVAGIATGEASADEARQLAFDPARSSDPRAARALMEDELFKISRLRTLLPRLEHLAHDVRDRETVANYAAIRDALQTEGDEIEIELTKTYRDAALQITNAFARASEFQAKARRELPSPPSGVESFRPFDLAITRLLQNVVLVGADGKQQLWPQRSSGTFAAEFAAGMIVPHPGAAWSSPEVQQQRREQSERDRQHLAGFYSRETEAQERRDNDAERERAAAMRRTG